MCFCSLGSFVVCVVVFIQTVFDLGSSVLSIFVYFRSVYPFFLPSFGYWVWVGCGFPFCFLGLNSVLDSDSSRFL